MNANAKRTATLWKVFGVLGGGVIAVVAGVLIFGTPDGDGSTQVPAPSAEMAQETSTKLAAATAAQRICYGWRLDDGTTTISEGSNLGPSTPIDPVQCPQWVEVQASVTYTDASSELEDYASVTIASAGLNGPEPQTSTLDRFGLGNKAFIDEPDWAVCQAALALPLLTAESADAKPVPTSAATGAPADLPGAGNDFWRDRYAYVVAAAALLAIAVLVLLIGWFDRRHQRATVRR
jgi:hypothetical protein